MLKNLYFLGIIPPSEIAGEITKMKAFCEDTYHCSHALNAPPHITIIPPFRATEAEVQTMFTPLSESAKKQKPVYIELKGYDHFSNRVVFVSVVENKALALIHTSFLKVIQKFFPPEDQKDPGFHAHITIAFKDVNPKQFEGIWNHFKDIAYDRLFLCREIVLLKYTNHHWQPLKTFSL